MGEMKTALTKGMGPNVKVDEKDFCFGLASVSKVAGKSVLWTKYVKRLSGSDKRIQDTLIGMKLRYFVKMRKKKDDEADAAALEADEDRLEDEIEEEFEEDLETTVEEYDDIEVGQDDDLEELERRAQEEGDAEEDSASDDEESEDEEESDEEDDEESDEEDEEEDADEDEEEDGDAAGPDRRIAALRLGPQVWHGTRKVMTSGLGKLKDAVRAEYKDEAADLVAEIEKNMGKLDKILEKLDHRLAEAMEKAHKAPDEKARKAELDNARVILKEHIAFVSSDPLIAHIDANPFGVKTNLKLNFVTAAKRLGKTIS